MKWFFAAVLVVHGLIHLLGFAKGFRLAEVAELSQPVSRAAGAAWLLAAALFVVTAILLFAAPSWWWVTGTGAVLLSQALIAGAWRDARFGTIANAIVLVPLVVAVLDHAPWGFRASYEREAERGMARRTATAVLTEQDAARLPALVQRYLRVTGALGKPRVQSFRARFQGQIKSRPAAAYMDFTAVQTSFFDEPTRLFLIDASMKGIPFAALHAYVGPSATMKVKVASLVTVVDAKGREMNQSETVTMLNDMCLLAPATLVDEHIQWEELGPLSVRATFTNAGNTVSAALFFNEAGELVNFHSDDRYLSADGKEYKKYRWVTPVRDYRSYGGARLASRGEAIWELPDGPLEYGRFELVEIEHNPKAR